MESNQNGPKEWLNAEFMRRQERNPRFSKRMFARQIGIPSGRLSELMNGKRQVTVETARRISAMLLLAPETRKELMKSLSGAGQTSVIPKPFEELSADAFHVIADWQHFAIYNLMDTDDFKPDYAWIAQRLNLQVSQAQDAVQRLMRLNLVVDKDGVWLKRSANITTTHDVESLALKISHRQSLEQVFESLDNTPLDKRDITSMTMAIDMKRLPEAKALIKKFRRDLSAFLEAGAEREEVYNLNIQLVPVTVLNSKDGQE